MALTPDYTLKIIHSDASITDAVLFHGLLRDIEASQTGVLYPTIHTYKEVDLGGGAIFPAIDFINGWTLQFPAGNWIISGGNINATINPVAGCYVKQTQSAAYAVTDGGGSGASAADVWSYLMDGTRSAQDVLLILAAVAAGKSSIVPGAPNEAEVAFRNLNDTKNVVTAQMVGSERSSVTLDP